MQKFLRGAIALNVAALAGLSVYAVLTQPISGWTALVILLCDVLAIVATTFFFRRPDDIFFSPITVLLGGLVAGRLLSTVWLVPRGAPPPDVTPLVLGETGPGVAGALPVTLLLVVLLAAFFATTALDAMREGGGAERQGLTPSDWAMTFVRVYVGAMFVSHFTGHILAGPLPFGAFTSYFGSVGMPFPAASVILAGLIEVSVCIGFVYGFLTRIAAVGGAVYLLLAVGLGGHFSDGYSWVLPNDGWEFPALWAFALAIFAITGAGPLSIDAILFGRGQRPLANRAR